MYSSTRSSDTRIVLVFDHPLDSDTESRIEKAVQKIEPTAYCVAGWRRPDWRPGWVAVDGRVDPRTQAKVREVAIQAKGQ